MKLANKSLLVAFMCLLFAGAVSAGECALRDSNRDTGWIIRYNDAQVTSCSFVGNAGTGRNKGTLTLGIRLNNNLPIDVQMIQVNRAIANNFGARITLNLDVTNNYAVIKRLRGKMIDRNEELEADMNEFVDDVHPGDAHNHQDATFNSGPFRGGSCGCESENSFDIRGDSPAGFGFWQIKGIGVHQIEHKGFTRSFTLRIFTELA